jgi:hypothetical protein
LNTNAKPVKGGVKLMGGANFGEASFNDPNFGGAYYALNDYHDDLFGATQSSTLGGGASVKNTNQNIKEFIIQSYLKLKEKFKRKPPADVLYKITKVDNIHDQLQVIKDGKIIFEETISEDNLTKIFCFFINNFKKKDIHSIEVNNDEYINTFTKYGFKLERKLPEELPTRYVIEKDTKTNKLMLSSRIILLPVSIIVTIIFWLSVLTAYLPVKVYCANKLKNKTIRKSSSRGSKK